MGEKIPLSVHWRGVRMMEVSTLLRNCRHGDNLVVSSVSSFWHDALKMRYRTEIRQARRKEDMMSDFIRRLLRSWSIQLEIKLRFRLLGLEITLRINRRQQPALGGVCRSVFFILAWIRRQSIGHGLYFAFMR